MIQQEINSKGLWIPLMEYATKKNISLSTLRRYIKADKVVYKVEQGRYLLWDDMTTTDNSSESALTKNNFEETTIESEALLRMTLGQLERDLKKANEEIAELKTLIALYEEQIPQHRLSG